jgi:hypothetical protein
MIISYLSIAVITYIVTVKPFNDPMINNLEVFNECCVMGCAYHLIVFSDYVQVDDASIVSNAGLSMLAVCGFNIFVNTTLMFIKTVGVIRRLFKKLKFKIRLHNYIKNMSP